MSKSCESARTEPLQSDYIHRELCRKLPVSKKLQKTDQRRLIRRSKWSALLTFFLFKECMSSLNLLPVKLGWSNRNTRDSIPASQTGFKISVQSLSGRGARHLSEKCCDSEGQMICDTWHHGCKHCCTALMFRPSDNSACKKRKKEKVLIICWAEDHLWKPLSLITVHHCVQRAQIMKTIQKQSVGPIPM